MRVHDHEQRAGSTHTERDEALFAKGVRVFPRERVVVGEYRCRFRKRNVVLPEVGFGFFRIPLYVHRPDCMDKRPASQAAEGVLPEGKSTRPGAVEIRIRARALNQLRTPETAREPRER